MSIMRIPNNLSRTEWEASWGLEGIQVAEYAWVAGVILLAFTAVSVWAIRRK